MRPGTISLLGIGLALAAACLWGCGDFSGGLGVRRGHAFGVLLISACSGIVLLCSASVWLPEHWPDRTDLLWSLGAGASGALGLTALYAGLARGRVAVVASSTAVIGATLPVVYGIASNGLLAGPQLCGMGLALLGLFTLTSVELQSERGTGGLLFGVLAGVGVSGFMIGMAQVESGVIWPLLLARVAGVTVAVVALLAGPRRPIEIANGWAVAAGLCDAGGNILYVVSLDHLPLELAAILSSLYPAVTVFLGARFLHQRVDARQWLGVALCLAGVGLISGS